MKKRILPFMIAIGFITAMVTTAKAGNAILMQSGTVTTCAANFYDSGGPDANYSNSEQDTLIIVPPANLPGAKISVTFHSFLTEETDDYLRVYSGGTVTPANLICQLGGGTKYGTIRSTAADGKLTFLFHSSNTNNNYFGWNASITVDTMPDDITMIANGTWTTSFGRFFDSGGPLNNYENNANVTTTIYPANAGEKLSVTFHSCDIGLNDVLTIFNGNSPGAPVLGSITASSYNFGTITSTAADGSLTFNFQSGPTTTEAGWNASITVNENPEDITPIANGTYLVSNGRFFDSGGELQDYPNNKLVGQTTITMLPKNTGDKVSVTFHESEIIAGDFLYVYDGPTASSPLIAALTDNNIGTVKSSHASGALTFQFSSNASGTGAGWNASISTNENPEEITTIGNGSFVVGRMARFYDNGGPGLNYGDGKYLVTTLTPAVASDKVSVTFHSFVTQLNNDYLYVYNGSDTNATLLGTYTGTINVFSVASTNVNGALTFKFVSNANSNNAGWFATATCLASVASYNIVPNTTTVDTTDAAFFYDDGGPNGDYADGLLNVPGTIHTFYPQTPGAKLSVTFTYFGTYNFGDYLEIYDGSNVFTAPKIISLSDNAGYGTISASATNTTGSLTFKFVSDAAYNTGGWAAFISTDINPQVISMPGVFTTNSGFYMDAGGNAGNYTDNVESITTIQPVGGIGKISLLFSHFRTYNFSDFIEVHDGPSVTDSIIAIINTYAGYGTITSTHPSGSLTLRFYSDGGYHTTGWAAQILNNAAPQNVAQHGVYTLNKGFFYDGGGPYADYTDNINNVITLKPVTTGDKMSVSFTGLTGWVGDVIEVYDGDEITDPLLTTLTASTGYGTVTATNAAGDLTFHVTSDGGYNAAGWVGAIGNVAAPTLISLPGTYLVDNGFLYDAGGAQQDYTDNTNDVITIKPATANTSISLLFNSFFTNNSIADSLEIFNGNSVNAPKIGMLNGNITDTLFTSTAADGSLTVRYITDGGYNYAGYAASITNNINCVPNLSITDMATQLDYALYPNPTAGIVTLQLNDVISNNCRYQVFNTTGKLLQENNIATATTELRLHYDAGIYFIKLFAGDKTSVAKVVLQ